MSAGMMNIRLSTPRAVRPTGEVTSLRLLGRRLPKQAFEAFQKGMRDNDKGRPEEAAGNFRAALKLYPDFAEAHANLGTWYARNERWTEALLEFEQAREDGLE